MLSIQIWMRPEPEKINFEYICKLPVLMNCYSVGLNNIAIYRLLLWTAVAVTNKMKKH